MNLCSFVRLSIMSICVQFFCSFNLNAQYWQPQFLQGGTTHQYMGGFWGGGLSAADFDKDGYDDLLFCQRGANALFFKSDGTYLQSFALGLQNSGEIKQLTWVDFDNDGDRDLSMSGLNMPVQLFRNVSNTFIPVSENSGISADSIVSYGHCWGDYDRDGDLDLFVCNYDAEFMGYVNSDNQLYRNDGSGLFTDVTLSAGFAPMENYTFMSLWMDYNRDLYPDLLVINDRYEVPNYFYHNNGDGTFTEIGAEANLDDYIFGMTATADDFDNDGDLDIYVTNGTSGNRHKVNNGDGTFTDADEQLGTTLNRFCWAAQFIDADRDGLQDLHVCSTPHVSLLGQNMLYRNYGEVFLEDTDSAGIAGDGGWSRASAVADFNGDGLADMAVCKAAPSISSIWSGAPNSNHSLKVTLEGVVSNRDGVSAWIDCYTGGNRQTRYTYCGEGYLGQNSFSEFFGLGSQAIVDSLVVSWPSGIVDRWFNIPADQQLYLVEGTSRRVDLAAYDGLIFCEDSFVSLAVYDWTELQWSTGSQEVEIIVGEEGPVWALATDEWGNQFLSDTIQLMQSPFPEVFVHVEDVSCFGYSDGILELSSDVVGLQYTIDGQNFFPSGVDGLSAGSYSVMWVDTLGCSGYVNAAVYEPEVFQVESIVHDVTCFGANDGSVEFLFSGGTPDYVLIGEGVATSQLGPGGYLFMLSDSHGCVALVSEVIEEPELMVPSVTSLPEEDSFANGFISASVTGGTFPYFFYLDSVYSADGNWANLSTGTYWLTIMDTVGCSVELEVEVELVSGIEDGVHNPLRIYPNPVTSDDFLSIESVRLAVECIIYNAHGTAVIHAFPNAQRFSVNTSDLQSGAYWMLIQTESGSFRSRFMVVD